MPHHLLWLLPTQAALGDWASTVGLLQAGGRELNPILGSHLGRLTALKGAETALTLLALDHLSRTHPRLAWALSGLVTAVWASAAAWNLSR